MLARLRTRLAAAIAPLPVTTRGTQVTRRSAIPRTRAEWDDAGRVTPAEMYWRDEGSATFRAVVDAWCAFLPPRLAPRLDGNDARALAVWEAFAPRATVDGLDVDAGMALLAREWALSGEAYAVMTTTGQIQIFGGQDCVEIVRAETGQILAYRFSTMRETAEVSASDVLAIRSIRRSGEMRGESPLRPALSLALLVDRFDSTELQSAIVTAAGAFQITRNDAGAGMAVVGDETTETGGRVGDIRPGSIFDELLPGERVEAIGHAGRPSQSWPDMRDRLIGATATAAAVDPSAVSGWPMGSYSAARQTRTVAERYARHRHAQFTARVLSPLWAWLTMRAGIVAPATWSYEPLPPIDPMRSAGADETLLRAGLASRKELIAARGGDPVQTMADRAMEGGMDGNGPIDRD